MATILIRLKGFIWLDKMAKNPVYQGIKNDVINLKYVIGGAFICKN
jgi:hypothetical protein